MAKVKIAKIVNDGPYRVRVFLSNGDELEGLATVSCRAVVDAVTGFVIEGYFGREKIDGE